MTKQKLELTWIGKEMRHRLEPRILLEDSDKSYHVAFRWCTLPPLPQPLSRKRERGVESGRWICLVMTREARMTKRREGFPQINAWQAGKIESIHETLPSPVSGRGAGGEGRRERAAILLTRAKTMRSHQTEAEQRLWFHLRAQRFMGLKFKRQKPVGPFIVDFVCLELGLVIEADGGQHGDEKDRDRDDWLKREGFVVLHFWNNDILQRTQAVLEQVRLRVLALSPPLPQAGEGSNA